MWQTFIVLFCLPLYVVSDQHWSSNVVLNTATPDDASDYQCYRLLKPRNHSLVVTMLLPPPGHHVDWLSSFPKTIQNLRKNNLADVLLFQPDWSSDQVASLQAKLPEAQILCIARADWTAKRNFKEWEFVERGFHGAGYRSMCRWYGMKVYSIFFQMGYEYMIRLDTDSEIRSPIPYDMVKVMKEQGAVYGFRSMSLDAPSVVRGLPEASRCWLAIENMMPTYLLDYFTPNNMTGLSMEGWSKRIHFNNFFIADLRWWVQPKVQGWLHFLENLNGFYKIRWGDHVVQTFTLGMFCPKNKVIEFGFDYSHKGAVMVGFNSFFPHFNGTLSL